MTEVEQIRNLVIIAVIGFVIVLLTFIPAIRRAWKNRSIAGGFVIFLVFADGWLLLFLSLLLVSYYRPSWIPGHTSLVLAALAAIEPWIQLIWYLRWRHRVIERIEQ